MVEGELGTRMLGFYISMPAYYYQFCYKNIVIVSADILVRYDCIYIHFLAMVWVLIEDYAHFGFIYWRYSDLTSSEAP